MIIQTVMEIPNRLSIVFFLKKVVPFSTVYLFWPCVKFVANITVMY